MYYLHPNHHLSTLFKTFPTNSNNFSSKLTLTIYEETYEFYNLPSFNKYLATIYDYQVKLAKRKNHLPKFKAIIQKTCGNQIYTAQINNKYNIYNLTIEQN